MILFMLWSAMIRACVPCCVVFENVAQFPVQVLIDVLGHLYCVFAVRVDAVTWIGAVRRKLVMQSLYVVDRHVLGGHCLRLVPGMLDS